MEQARPRSRGGTGLDIRRDARARDAARRTARVALGLLLRAALITLPVLALRALFAPREPPVSRLSDRQLADIGLTRADVTRPHERPGAAELELQRLMRGQQWR